jgi:hypothetical protein
VRPVRLAGPVVFAAASKRWRRSIDLDCRPDRLFDVFEDAGAWPAWATPITKVEWTSPLPPQIGTTRTVHMLGGLTAEERFTAYDRGRHMQFVFTHVTEPVLMDGFGEDYRVVDVGDDRCRLTWTVVMEPAGAGRFTMPLAGPAMPFALGHMLSGLQTHVREHVSTAQVT